MMAIHDTRILELSRGMIWNMKWRYKFGVRAVRGHEVR
jgi:hypothetical protein